MLVSFRDNILTDVFSLQNDWFKPSWNETDQSTIWNTKKNGTSFNTHMDDITKYRTVKVDFTIETKRSSSNYAICLEHKMPYVKRWFLVRLSWWNCDLEQSTIRQRLILCLNLALCYNSTKFRIAKIDWFTKQIAIKKTTLFDF